MRIELVMPAIWLCLALTAWGQGTRPPSFKDYPAAKLYSNVATPPQLGSPKQYSGADLRCFGGDNAAYANRPVNFAGQFVIAACTCGTGCHYLFMWDARTGKLYRDLPPGAINIGPYGVGELAQPIEYQGEQYRSDSTLLVIEGCIEGTCDCATRYYIWGGDRFTLIMSKISRMPPRCEK